MVPGRRSGSRFHACWQEPFYAWRGIPAQWQKSGTPPAAAQSLALAAILALYVAATEAVKNMYYAMFRREIVAKGDLRVLKERAARGAA